MSVQTTNVQLQASSERSFASENSSLPAYPRHCFIASIANAYGVARGRGYGRQGQVAHTCKKKYEWSVTSYLLLMAALLLCLHFVIGKQVGAEESKPSGWNSNALHKKSPSKSWYQLAWCRVLLQSSNLI